MRMTLPELKWWLGQTSTYIERSNKQADIEAEKARKKSGKGR